MGNQCEKYVLAYSDTQQKIGWTFNVNPVDSKTILALQIK